MAKQKELKQLVYYRATSSVAVETTATNFFWNDLVVTPEVPYD